VCPTMGQHNDVFHPHSCTSMQSYYLKGDDVGGSSEVVIVNKSLIKNAAEWTKEAIHAKITARLNAPVAAPWEADPCCQYMSDMAPYLIRVGCCFEYPGQRYYVNPKKLLTLLEPILKK
jgi:hypothetical protein